MTSDDLTLGTCILDMSLDQVMIILWSNVLDSRGELTIGMWDDGTGFEIRTDDLIEQIELEDSDYRIIGHIDVDRFLTEAIKLKEDYKDD